MNSKQESIIKKIRRYIVKDRKFEPFLEIRLFNRSPYNFYIVCGYDEKKNFSKLFWMDLDAYKILGIKAINEETLFSSFYPKLEDYVLNNNCESFEEYNSLYPDYAYIEMKINEVDYSFKFSRHIPVDRMYAMNIVLYIFDFLPVIMQKFVNEMLELKDGKTIDYQKYYCFDLEKDDLGRLFSNSIIDSGATYVDNIKFLEKIGDSYYAVVSGTEDYLVVLSTVPNTNWIYFTCSCPCEFACKHVAAVIMGIRKKKYRKFYKLTFNDDNRSLLDRVLNKNFILCLDVVDDNYIVVDMSNRIITNLSINSNVSIIEDSNDYLKNKLNK